MNLETGLGKMGEKNRPQFGFQWHITDRCNLRCIHCYQQDYSGSSELDLAGLKSIADEIIKTLSKWEKQGDIAITGGEPLMKEELLPLMHYLESAEEIASIDILTNGTLINGEVVKEIKRLNKIRCVQISVDGASPTTNDAIRGAGVFNKAIKAIQLLIDNNVLSRD